MQMAQPSSAADVQRLQVELENAQQLVDFLRPYKARAEAAEGRVVTLLEDLAAVRRRVASLEGEKAALLEQNHQLSSNASVGAVGKKDSGELSPNSFSVHHHHQQPQYEPYRSFEDQQQQEKLKFEPGDDDVDELKLQHQQQQQQRQQRRPQQFHQQQPQQRSAYDGIADAAAAAAAGDVDTAPDAAFPRFPHGAALPKRGAALDQTLPPRGSGGGATYAIGAPSGGPSTRYSATLTGGGLGGASTGKRDRAVVPGSGSKANRPEVAGGAATTTAAVQRTTYSGMLNPVRGPAAAHRRASNASPSPGTVVTNADGRRPEHLGQVSGPPGNGGITPSPAAIPPAPHQHQRQQQHHLRQPAFSSLHQQQQEADYEYPANPAPSRSNVLSTSAAAAPAGGPRSAIKRGALASAMEATAAASRREYAAASTSNSRAGSLRQASPSGADGRPGNHAPRTHGRQPAAHTTTMGGGGSSMRAGTTATSNRGMSTGSVPLDSPMPMNPAAGPDVRRVFIFSMLDREDKLEAQQIIRRIGKRAEVLELPPGTRELPPEVTHVVTQPDGSSEKALIALVSGRTVVDMSYLRACRDCGLWAAEEAFPGVTKLAPSQPLSGVDVAVDAEQVGDHLESVIAVLRAGGARTCYVDEVAEEDLARITVRINSADNLVDIIREYE